MFKSSFSSPFGSPFGSPFVFPFKRGGAVPPVLGNLLAWIKGNSTDTERIDSYTSLGDFPMEITESPCCVFDGVADRVVIPTDCIDVRDGFDIEFEYIHSDTQVNLNPRLITQQQNGDNTPSFVRGIFALGIDDDGSNWILRYGVNGGNERGTTHIPEGHNIIRFTYDGNTTASVYLNGILEASYSTVTPITEDQTNPIVVGAQMGESEISVLYFLTGSFYNLTIRSYTGNITTGQFDFAEGAGTVTYDRSGNDNHGAVVTSDIGDFRAGTQDTHHPLVIKGWWDNGLGSYDSVNLGSGTFHPAGKWNQAPCKYSFVERSRAEFDGTGDKISTVTDHGSILSSGGTAILSYDGSDITSTVGSCWNIIFSDGTIIPLDEGTGTDIKNSDGVSVGTLVSSDVDDFWANTIAPPEIITADTSWNFFTDSNYNAEPRTESEFDFSVDGLNQYFFNSDRNKGLLVYDQVLTGNNLEQVLNFVDQLCYITFDGENTTFDGENIYMRTS